MPCKYPRLCFIFAVGLLLLSARSPSSLLRAQQNPCDPNLMQLGQNPEGYRQRGDRCEGIYIEPFSGSTTPVIPSFTAVFDEFDPRANLRVEWSSLAELPIHFRA